MLRVLADGIRTWKHRRKVAQSILQTALRDMGSRLSSLSRYGLLNWLLRLGDLHEAGRSSRRPLNLRARGAMLEHCRRGSSSRGVSHCRALQC